MPPPLKRISCPEIPKLHAAFGSWHEVLAQICALRVEPPMHLSWDGGPPNITLPAKTATEKWFKLVANSGGGAYTSSEVEPTATGTWAVAVNGISPTLYEVNLYPSISLTGNVYVYAYRMRGVDEWRFQLGGCS